MVQVRLTYAVDIQKVEIATKIHSENMLERTLSFYFDPGQAELTGENFENKLRARMDEAMTLDTADADGMKAYTVHIPADSPEGFVFKDDKVFGRLGERGRIDQHLCGR